MVAAASGLWGVAVTFLEPKGWKLKGLAMIPFGALAVIGWWLVRAQTRQQTVTEQANKTEQVQTQAKLDQTQGKVDELQGKVNRIESAMFEPGNANEKLDNIAKIVGANILPPPATESPVTPLNGIPFKGSFAQRLDILHESLRLFRAYRYDSAHKY